MSSQQPQIQPYPGLRHFSNEEDFLFFGREQQVTELLKRLRSERLLAVVGSSGSGKSSLVRAGLLPALFGGTMTEAGSHWEAIVLRPGSTPIANLAQAFLEADLYDAEQADARLQLKATLGHSHLGLVEAARQSDLEERTNLLVVVDQFEELFRFDKGGPEEREAADAFVQLLLEAARQRERGIYIVITIRSDYLGDCSQIPELAEAVNRGEYLIPRLTRDQQRDAIEKPANVGGAQLEPALVQKLLNEVGDDADQLPVLQHALMRIWECWKEDHTDGEPIGLRHYERMGGMAQALSIHGDEVYDQLPIEEHRRVAERVFKALTERGSDNRAIRRPTTLGDLVRIAGTKLEHVETVVDAYRATGRTFLMPPEEVPLTERTVVDISHESLMRVWNRLGQWVDEESQSARIFVRLAETAELH